MPGGDLNDCNPEQREEGGCRGPPQRGTSNPHSHGGDQRRDEGQCEQHAHNNEKRAESTGPNCSGDDHNEHEIPDQGAFCHEQAYFVGHDRRDREHDQCSEPLAGAGLLLKAAEEDRQHDRQNHEAQREVLNVFHEERRGVGQEGSDHRLGRGLGVSRIPRPSRIPGSPTSSCESREASTCHRLPWDRPTPSRSWAPGHPRGLRALDEAFILGAIIRQSLDYKCLSYILTVVASPESDARPFPALLRAAWRTYGSVVREALSEVGFDDMPRNGAYVVSGIAGSGAPLSGIIEQLGVSRQAGGQLVDSLVASGYLDRSVDPRDRRRLTITLTERGRAAAKVIRSAVDRQNDLLVRRVGAEHFELTRRPWWHCSTNPPDGQQDDPASEMTLPAR